MIWRKPVRKRWVRRRQVRRNAMISSERDRRAASDTAASTDDDEPEFDGYAVELLSAVAHLLRVHLEFYAVPLHSSSSARSRTRDYGMWSPLVDQLLTEASLDVFPAFLRSTVYFVFRPLSYTGLSLLP